MKKYAIMTYAIGDKYKKRLEPLIPHFESYANKCNADFIIIDNYIDKEMKRNFYCQKMLLPSIYSKYDWIVWVDSDIIINKNAPSIFDTIQENKGFSAVCVPVGTPWWKSVVINEWRNTDALNQSKIQIYINKGFDYNDKLTDYINDGVTLCNTKLMAKLFEDFYYIGWGKTGKFCNDSEGAAGYVSQVNDLFWLMDKKWNYQISYPYWGIEDNRARFEHRFYVQFVKDQLKKCYMLHFAGAKKIPIVDYDDPDKITDVKNYIF